MWGVRTVMVGLEGDIWLGGGTEHFDDVGLERRQVWAALMLKHFESGKIEEALITVESLACWKYVLHQVAHIVIHDRVRVVHIIVLGYLVEKGGDIGDEARQLLGLCLSGECRFQGAEVAGRSDRSAGWAVVLEGVRKVGMLGAGKRLLGAVEGIVWRGEGGVQLMEELFVAVERWRSRIIAGIRQGLMGGEHGFCDLLERICAGGWATGVAEEVVALLDGVQKMKLNIGVRLVTCVVKFVGGRIGLGDKVWIWLKKAMGLRGRKMQKVVLCGLVEMLWCGEVDHVVGLLKPMWDRADVDVRKYVLNRIMQRFDEKTGRSQLADVVLRDFRASVVSKDGRFVFSGNFVKSITGWVRKDDIPVLLMYCRMLAKEDVRVAQMLTRFNQYLTDVDGAIREACQMSTEHAPTYMRLEQLCFIFEALCCLSKSQLSSNMVHLYSLSILIRDNKAIQGNSRKKEKMDASLNDLDFDEYADDEVLASMTVEEVRALKKTDDPPAADVNILLSFHDYLDTLLVLSKKPIAPTPLAIVRGELLRLLVDKFLTSKSSDEANLTSEFRSKLISIISTCFPAACPWNQRLLRSQSAQEKKGRAAPRKKRRTRSRCAELDSTRQTSSRTAAEDSDLENFSRICNTLSSQPFDDDVKSTWASSRLSKAHESCSLCIRQLVVRSLLVMFSQMPRDASWVHHLCIIGRVIYLDGYSGNGRRENERTAIESMKTLSKVVRQEFESSLSSTLSLSYLELYGSILERLVSKRANENSATVREIMLRSIIGLLKDFSVPHIRILRSMVPLLLNTFPLNQGLKFSSSLVTWLGNETCVLNSRFGAQEEREVLDVQHFDEDIWREAIGYSTQGVEDDAEEILGNEEDDNCDVQRKQNCGIRNLDTESEESLNFPSNENSVEDLTSIETVRSLCLNETGAGALLSLQAAIIFATKAARLVLERSKKGSMEDGENEIDEGCVVQDVVDVLRALLETPFAQIENQRSSKIPSRMLRSIAVLVQTLLEIADLKLRSVMKKLDSSDETFESVEEMGMIIKIMEFVNEDQTVSYLSVLRKMRHVARLAFFQEKLDSTSTSFMLISKQRKNKQVRQLQKLVDKRLKVIQSGKDKDKSKEGEVEGAMYSVLQTRGSKRQRVRSRNKHVDEWLQDETGEDNYADLENFVVPMEESNL